MVRFISYIFILNFCQFLSIWFGGHFEKCKIHPLLTRAEIANVDFWIWHTHISLEQLSVEHPLKMPVQVRYLRNCSCLLVQCARYQNAINVLALKDSGKSMDLYLSINWLNWTIMHGSPNNSCLTERSLDWCINENNDTQ